MSVESSPLQDHKKIFSWEWDEADVWGQLAVDADEMDELYVRASGGGGGRGELDPSSTIEPDLYNY
jgi:hypothetical protein